jgi:2-polyprenyl-6-methoxyphenol hydroxylase-like FAD-dependent oxidoreductase
MQRGQAERAARQSRAEAAAVREAHVRLGPKEILIVGGSVSGLAAALMLAEDGHRVTVLEKDATPLPSSASEAFEKWNRRGAPQVRHSHAFLAPVHNGIRDRAPELLEKLLAAGAEVFRFEQMARAIFPEPHAEPGDAEISLLGVRRVTFEWVLRRHILDLGRVSFRDGVEVRGLAAEPGEDGVPRVRGVRVTTPHAGDTTLAADLVVDASGRGSHLGAWLEGIGARALREESEPCGIFYSSRFYRLREGALAPAVDGITGADLGYLKCGIFPADARTFSITLAASPDDPDMACVAHEAGFEAAARAIPLAKVWIDPSRAEPISRVHGMGRLTNTRRFFVQDGVPAALGVAVLGDALLHQNPLYGRGCTLAWLHAELLAEALRQQPDDARAFALALDAGVEKRLVPWFELARNQDRDAIEAGAAQRRGEDPFRLQREDGTVDPKAYVRSLVRDGFLPALREDLTVLRAFMRMMTMLDPPGDLMKSPAVLQRALASWSRRGEREPLRLGPTRAEMLEVLATVA